MKKDLLIQKMVKIAKTQQILLKKLANIDFSGSYDDSSLPKDFDRTFQLIVGEMKHTIATYSRVGLPINGISSVCPGIEDFKKLAKDEIDGNEFGYGNDWKPDHYGMLLDLLNKEFDKLNS